MLIPWLALLLTRCCMASILQSSVSIVPSDLSLVETLGQSRRVLKSGSSKSGRSKGRSRAADKKRRHERYQYRISSKDSKSGKSYKSRPSSKSGKKSKSEKSPSKGGRSGKNYRRSQYSSKSEKSSKTSKSGKDSKSGKSGKDSKSGKSSVETNYDRSRHHRYQYSGNYKSNKSGKTSKSPKNSKDNRSSRSSSKSSKSDLYWKSYYWYWFQYWKENVKEPQKEVHQTDSPTQAPTVHPEGTLHRDDGYVGCFALDDIKGTDVKGDVRKRTLSFDYTMKTTSDADTARDVKDMVEDMERAFAEFLGGKLDCGSSSGKSPKARRLYQSRRLASVGFDPSPSDIVIDDNQCNSICCGSGCYSIGASMTVFTTGDENDVCSLGDDLSAFADNYDSGSVEGVSSIGIDKSSISSDGEKCSKDNIPNSVVTIVEDDKDDTLLSALLYPFLILALLLFAAFIFVRRRRRLRNKEEEMRLGTLNESDLDDDDLAFGAGYRKYALNAVNVHKCHSAQCASCRDNNKETEFLPLENVSKWIEQKKDQKDMKLESISEDVSTDLFDDKDSKELERIRIMEDARRVLQDGRTTFDEVDADRYDDRLRGLPTVPEASDSDDTERTPRKVVRADMETGSV